MNRIAFIVMSLLLLCYSIASYAVEENPQSALSLSVASPLDGGGTYCNAAAVIDSSTTNFIDTGYLDLDNDCSNPFPWPYNDVFYKFRPTESRTYIMRLQIFAPFAKAAIRVTANSCCAGGTTVAADTNNVSLDCDSGATAYLRATLTAGTWYWFHLGDMSATPHDYAYRFQLMYVPCPVSEDTIPHNTPGSAQFIAIGDSVMGDSSSWANPDWYRFTLTSSDSVIITEVGREFGHCVSGFYPSCMTNPLSAHFIVYCDSFGHSLGEGHDELCSNDGELRLCLPAGTYWIRVANYGGNSWVGWNYILSVRTVPGGGNCPPLPTACGEQLFLCPGGYDSLVTLTPVGPPPGPQHVQACVRLDTTNMTTIVVPVQNANNHPTVTVATACSTCAAEPNCQALVGTWSFDTTGWVFQDNPPRFINHIIANPGATGCCVCVTLEFVLPVELLGFTAIAGDGQVALNWSTASESHNDHFELQRDGVPVAVVRGAGNSAEQHTYRWTDEGLSNDQVYTYTLITVDQNGNRVTAAAVNALPVATAGVVTEYALRQNYPNPFNPSTQISFDLVEKGFVSLKVYNLMGQEVASLVNGSVGSGRHIVTFDATSLPSGIYLYRLNVNGFSADRKMLLLK